MIAILVAAGDQFMCSLVPLIIPSPPVAKMRLVFSCFMTASESSNCDMNGWSFLLLFSLVAADVNVGAPTTHWSQLGGAPAFTPAL